MKDSTRQMLRKVGDVLYTGGYELISPGLAESQRQPPSPEYQQTRRYKIVEALRTGGLSLVFKQEVEQPPTETPE